MLKNAIASNQKMKDFYELVEAIRLRPSMYLGERRISLLNSYLSGYSHAIYIYRIQEQEFPPFGYFHDWTADKFKGHASAAGWCRIILEENNGDEDKALDHFFQLLDEFRQLKVKRIIEVNLTQENIDYFYSPDCKIFRGPLK